jgi:hypothetical protein
MAAALSRSGEFGGPEVPKFQIASTPLLAENPPTWGTAAYLMDVANDARSASERPDGITLEPRVRNSARWDGLNGLAVNHIGRASRHGIAGDFGSVRLDDHWPSGWVNQPAAVLPGPLTWNTRSFWSAPMR